ncbi:hypothetical protein AMTRI_Chr04g190080 [Amborella trichopoda]
MSFGSLSYFPENHVRELVDGLKVAGNWFAFFCRGKGTGVSRGLSEHYVLLIVIIWMDSDRKIVGSTGHRMTAIVGFTVSPWSSIHCLDGDNLVDCDSLHSLWVLM